MNLNTFYKCIKISIVYKFFNKEDFQNQTESWYYIPRNKSLTFHIPRGGEKLCGMLYLFTFNTTEEEWVHTAHAWIYL